MKRFAEAFLGQVRQIFERVRRNAVRLRIGTAQNHRRERSLLIRRKPGRPPLTPLVAQTLRTLRIVADDRRERLS